MPVKVVRCGHTKIFQHYIGRIWGGYPESLFHNPFHIGKDGTRDDVIAKFAAYWYAPEQDHLRNKALHMINPDDTLGCWCYPFPCHGDIIAGYVDWKHQEARLWD